MVKILLIVNALLTLPFGVFALIMPLPVFAQFGVQLNDAGALVARGYGATLVGYGLLQFLLRESTNRDLVRSLLLSMAVFNTIEAIIQGAAGVQGVATKVIFGNVVIHAVVAVFCVVAWSGHRDKRLA
jgi:hypothetical protein